MFRQGDLVVRKSYNRDLLFRIEQLMGQHVILRGVEYRLLADSEMGDLDAAAPNEREHRSLANETTMRLFDDISNRDALLHQDGTSYFELPGKVLHLDGDHSYLRKSMAIYEQLRIEAHGFYVHETQMAEALRQLLSKIQPDIVVITGHDGIIKQRREQHGIYSLESYKNSENFVKAVKVARQYEKNRDTLTIIAGACQSYFEALLQAGANFASSPARILIHALDPVYIAAKVAFTSVKDTVNIHDVIRNTISGVEGIGGIESKGSYRIGLPKVIFQQKEGI